MKKYIHAVGVLLCLLFSVFLSAQSTKKHTVVQGETVTRISQMYKITPHDIYRLNPGTQDGLKIGDVLNIPSSSNALASTSSSTHHVQPKETLYGIAKTYNLTVDQLKAMNPAVESGLQIGQVLVIKKQASTASNLVAATAATPTSNANSALAKKGDPVIHIVESGETKFGIAKKYGITVAELEAQNPGIKESLPVGYKLTIYTNTSGSTIVDSPSPTTPIRQGYANYEVKPKETIFSLTQSLGISEAELIRLNPSLKDGLKVGMILKVPGRGSMVISGGRGFKDLTQTIYRGDRKKLALLVPFNLARIESDSSKSLAERFKSDAFLNMTLDFYSGALMAIDSAKTLGLNVDVQIFDSGETRTNSNVAEIIRRNELNTFNAVIGPFYQEHADKTAQLLEKDSVAVISPLSKDKGKNYKNLYQAIPPVEYTKGAVFDYMMSKGGNIIVVSGPKRESNRNFIKDNYPQALFTQLDENGNILPEKLKGMLVKGRKNYVVLDSEKTGLILSTTNVLLTESASYDIQLVIMEQNETLDFEEISMKRLTILNLLYPSLIRENNSPEAHRFNDAYRRENKILPSQYAVRGFDVTFDTLLRLSQQKSFSQSAEEDQTEQIESKFDYRQNPAGGHINKGVYILQFEEDLSVTEAK
ncbi:MAG: LysM peptidoglycan-binding domain-containing protein [Flavobacterium sp.]|nr:LysM peptidoglycan-binding domain-containing protein [Flavobacterium sp.]